jgi:hypothetical protein
MTMRWSEEQLADFHARTSSRTSQKAKDKTTQTTKRRALGRLPAGRMNKTEAAYARNLQDRQFAGEIAWYKFEAVKLRLADNTFYSPDFLVLTVDGALEVHEVKGFWEEDARVKIKVAASIYPLRFIAVTARSKKFGGGWDVEAF